MTMPSATDVIHDATVAYYNSLPDDLTVARVMLMEWGGHRNLAMWKTLGLRYPNPDPLVRVTVSRGPVIMVSGVRTTTAKAIQTNLRHGLPTGWTVDRNRRPDGRWNVTAYETPPDTTDWTAAIHALR